MLRVVGCGRLVYLGPRGVEGRQALLTCTGVSAGGQCSGCNAGPEVHCEVVARWTGEVAAAVPRGSGGRLAGC